MNHRWQFWHVGTDIKLRFTGTPENERFICNCKSVETAESLVKLLNNTARFSVGDLVDLLDTVKL